MAPPKMTDVREQDRLYVFPGGETIFVEAVIKFGVGKSGTHRLETKDGRKHIIAPGWLQIKLDLDEWTL